MGRRGGICVFSFLSGNGVEWDGGLSGVLVFDYIFPFFFFFCIYA